MKVLNNFFLLMLLFALFMLPMTVIDMATFAPTGMGVVLSTQSQVLPTGSDQLPSVDTSSLPQELQMELEAPEAPQTSPTVELDLYDYYQMPSLYLGSPEGVE